MAQFDTRVASGARATFIDEGLRAHMNKVYGTMSVGMVITGLAAWAISGLAVTATPNEYYVGGGEYLTSFGLAMYASPLKWLVMFAPLLMVFGFGAIVNRLSSAAAQTYFYAFAALMGASLSSIFLIYTSFSILQVFFITAAAFAALSLWGYTTKKDISAWGSFLIMGVVGLFIASIVSIFFPNPALTFAISSIGVLLFAGLTAWDTQQIKNTYIAHAHHGDSEWLAKSAIMGALNLYLDFINMFLFLLRLFGGQRE